MFTAKWKLAKLDFDLIEQIRREVFVEGMGINENYEFDARDTISAHILVCEEDGDPIGTARIFPMGHDTQIGRIAVRDKYKGMGYEDFLLRLLLYKASTLSGKNVITDALDYEKPYLEALGFKPSGDEFDFHGIILTPYSIPRDKICLEGKHEA